MNATAHVRIPFDVAALPVLRLRPRTADGDFTLPCGSYSGARWYCAETGPGRESLATDRLQHLGFAVFLPLCIREVRHARRVEVVQRPLFPRYLFLRFDVGADPWRRAYASQCVRIHGPTPEQPTPLPAGMVERWQAEGWDKPLARDLGPELIAAGAHVALTAGPFCDARGVCLWDDGTRCAVLLSVMGRQVQANMPREQVARA